MPERGTESASINELGKQGWELVAFDFSLGGNRVFYFKRALAEQGARRVEFPVEAPEPLPAREPRKRQRLDIK
jgi:hypothetical protein